MLILTRPQAQALEWQQRLERLGVPSISLPLIGIENTDGAAAREAWAHLPRAALAFFVSPNAASAFFAARADTWPEQTLAACVGPGTARTLIEHGVPEALIVQPPADAESLDSEHLWPLLEGRDWQGRLALMLRGEGGRDWLAARLRERGAQTRDVHLYRRVRPVWSLDQRERFEEALQVRHVWLLSSAEGARHLRQLAPHTDWSGQRAIATHERIAAAAYELGFGHVVLTRPDAEAVSEVYRAM
ncbi:uroporphyrinogen-III synthase [Burkholderiaceae bacterium UC74_6]